MSLNLIQRTYSEAAVARGKAAPARAARPSQRRNQENSQAPARGLGTLTTVTIEPVTRAGSGSSGSPGLDFHGVASVTGRGYEMWDWAGPYTEVVEPGSFTETLARANLDVPLVLNHDSLRRIARTTTGTLALAEVDDGLDVRAPELDPADADVQYVAPKILSGLVDEMSFMFRITAGQWSDDWMEYHIQSVDIHRGDVSIVGYGANPYTTSSLDERSLIVSTGDTRLAPDDLAALSETIVATLRSQQDASPTGTVVSDDDLVGRSPRRTL